MKTQSNSIDNIALPQVRWSTTKALATISAIAPLVFAPAYAQILNVPTGTNETAPVILNQTGGILNNNGSINVIGAGSNAVQSSADNTRINNGSATSTGVISGESRAVDISGGSGATVNNVAGSEILATGDQRNGTVYLDSDVQGVTINNDGLIDARGAGSDPASTNQGAGISAELDAAGNNFDINNTGTIAGSGSAAAGDAVAGDGIRLERTRVSGALNATTSGAFTGTITNSGSITSESNNGTTAGIRAVNGVSFQGTIENSGTISGVQNGVYLGNAVAAGGADHTGGVVNNSGNITSDSRAVNIDGTGLTVNNSGNILGTGDQRNGTVYADGTADDYTINNTGTIDAGAGNNGSGIAAEVGGAADGITNLSITNGGTIAGRGSESAATGAAGDGIRIGNAGNTGTVEGNITNSGTITSESTNGTTGAIRVVDGVGYQGTLENSGVIAGVQNGVYYGNGDHTGGVLNNSGDIRSNSRAVNIDGTGLTVNNSGNILATGNQRNGTVYADGTADDYAINNTGTIDAGAGNNGSGIAAEVGGAADGTTSLSITNGGTITGRGSESAASGAAGDGIRIGNAGNTGTVEGDITNSGTITSESTNGTTGGIRVVDGVGYQGTLENSGTISGAQNGVYYGNGDHTGGVLNNSGNITSDSRAVNIDGTGLTVNNSGNILGTGDQRNGTVYADGTADNYTINNTGVIGAGAGNNGSGIAAEIDADNTVQNANIVNSGSIIARGNVLASGDAAGVRIFGSSAPDALANINITNDTGGIISSESSAGVLIEGVTSTGSITNNGSITGTTAAIDTTSALGDITINQGTGSLNGGVRSGVGNDTLNITGDATVNGDINLGAGNNSTNVANGARLQLNNSNTIVSNLDVSGTLGISDPVNVTGDANFSAGSTVAIDTSDIVTQSNVDFVTATGALTDNGVALAETNNSLLLDFSIATTPNTLQLRSSAADVASSVQDPNIANFATALQSAIAAQATGSAFNNVTSSLNALANVGEFENAVAPLLPSTNIGITREVYNSQANAFDTVANRFQLDSAHKSSLWHEISAGTSDRDGGSQLTQSGYDANSFGITIGADTQISDAFSAGLAFTYSNIDIDDSGLSSQNTEIDYYGIQLYGNYKRNNHFISGQIAYGIGESDSTRSSNVGSIQSDSDLDQVLARVTTGYKFEYQKQQITPFASFQYGNTSQDSFSENGGLDFQVNASDVSVAELGIGVDYSTPFKIAGKDAKFNLKAAWYHDFADDERNLNVSFNNQAFDIRGIGADRNSLELEAGIGIHLKENLLLDFRYKGTYSSDFESHAGQYGLTWKF